MLPPRYFAFDILPLRYLLSILYDFDVVTSIFCVRYFALDILHRIFCPSIFYVRYFAFDTLHCLFCPSIFCVFDILLFDILRCEILLFRYFAYSIFCDSVFCFPIFCPKPGLMRFKIVGGGTESASFRVRSSQISFKACVNPRPAGGGGGSKRPPGPFPSVGQKWKGIELQNFQNIFLHQFCTCWPKENFTPMIGPP